MELLYSQCVNVTELVKLMEISAVSVIDSEKEIPNEENGIANGNSLKFSIPNVGFNCYSNIS